MSVFWHDRMNVYRWFDVEANGFTKNKKELLYSGVKCHYSRKNSLGGIEDSVPSITSNNIIFCSINTDLREGDFIEVAQRNGTITKLMVEEGFSYSNHQEFSVKRDDKA